MLAVVAVAVVVVGADPNGSNQDSLTEATINLFPKAGSVRSGPAFFCPNDSKR